MSNVINFADFKRADVPRHAEEPHVEAVRPDQVRVVDNPRWWAEQGHLGVSYLDTVTGMKWFCLRRRDGYSDHWCFRSPEDDREAEFETSDGYVPQVILDMAKPVMATFPPCRPIPHYDDDL